MYNKQAVEDFRAAREHYLARRFGEARGMIQRYRKNINYAQFTQTDCRPETRPELTIIIVSYQTNQALLDCLKSVFAQQGPAFEVILVDNGGNQSIHAELARQPLLWIVPPINFLPSEGRNIGAHYAQSDLIVFLDDDALIAPGYLIAAHQAMKRETVHGMRGRVTAKTPGTKVPTHYDLGESSKETEFNLEGNMVIRSQIFNEIGGFDPLMFGHEGRELTHRCKRWISNMYIEYCPNLHIQHDFAEMDRLESKRERQALGQDYLNYLYKESMSIGVSILVRAGSNLAGADDFFASFFKYNTHNSIEVMLWSEDNQRALVISRAYLDTHFIRVIPASSNMLSRIAKQIRYDTLLIVDIPTQVTSDALPVWLQNQQTNESSVLLCNKQQVLELANFGLSVGLDELRKKLSSPILNTINELDRHNSTDSHLKLKSPQVAQLKNFSIFASDNPRNVKNIKVSVIIPVYNKANTIQRAFESVYSSDQDDVEVIFIDDLSSDNSRDLIDDIRKSHKNIVSIFNRSNIGAGASRNIGINHAVGEYLFFLDADDQLDREVLSQLIEAADVNAADLVRGKIKGIKSDGTSQLLAKEHLLHNDFKVGVSWSNDKALWFYWYFTANLYRRSFLDKNYIRFPEGVRNEDPLFLCKCYLFATNIVMHPSTSYFYRIADAQQNRIGVEFLKGWVLGYYSIYQLICTSKIQTFYFLCLFPSLERHCRNITNTFDKDDAIKLLNYISVMFRSFDEDLLSIGSYLDELKQWKELVDTVNFAKTLSGRSALSIYNLLK